MQAPEANLFTGGLTQSIAIRIPPGRKMATPSLNLVYSSSGGSGPYGEGWSLPIGTVERSTKWGVPTCTGSAADEFVLTINGAATELVNFGSGGGGTVYRPRTDQSFLEAVRKTDNSWEVFDRSGMRYEFGKTAASRRQRDATCTTVWGLTKIKDPNDNTVDFTYVTGKDTLLVDKVEYGGDPGAQAFEVSFEYEGHPIPTTSWRNGTKEVVADRVSRIHVEVNAGSYLPRIYDLKYDDEYGTPPAPGCNAPDRVLLCELSVDDDMPTQSFEYATASFALTTSGSGAPPGGFHHLRSATANADVDDSVMDMNGDGRIDFVNAADGSDQTYTVYYGEASGGISTTASTWCASGGTIDAAKLRREADFENNYAWTQKETIDLTGDGLPDFVDATSLPWKVHAGALSVSCPNLGFRPGFLPTAADWVGAPEAFSTLTQKEHEAQVGDWVRTWKRLADMNADGRPDLVIASQVPNTNWTVYLNTGSAFVAQGEFSNSAGPISSELKTTSDVFRRTLRDLFDFNGDGLPDRVEGGSGSFLVYLNNGAGFDPALSIAATGESAIRVVKNPNGETEADFLDVSGDGLPDRVRIDTATGDWKVHLNRGTFVLDQEFTGEQSWGALGPIRENNSKGNTKIDMVDWNHDGLVDRVDAKPGNWGIRLGLPTSGPAVRPYLMTAAHNGIGGAFYPTYQPSTRFANTLLPFVSWVVTATRKTDGLCSAAPSACLGSGNEVQRSYTYAEGSFDGPTREFRGFGLVTELFPWTSGGLQGRRDTHFDQGEHTRGQIELQETKVGLIGGYATALRETYTWETQDDPDGPRTQVWLAEKKSEVLDIETGGGAHQCRYDRNLAPDVWGRVATRCTLPCGASNPGDCSDAVEGKVTTESVWADPGSPPSGAPVVRERPASVKVSYVKPGGGVETLSEQSFTYDWPRANVLTATTTGDATTGGDATVTTAYDYMPPPVPNPYGNMTSVTDARGGQATSVYSGTPFSLFPSSESNAVGHTVQTQWDLRHGKETQVIGPNGEVTVAVYDKAGRVTCEAKPGSSCTGVPSATYTYSYGNPGAATWEGKLSYAQVQTREPNNATGSLPGYLLTRTYFDALGRERATATWRWSDETDMLVWVVTKQVEYLGLGQPKKVYAPYQANPAGSGTVGLQQAPSSAFTEYDYFPLGIIVDPTGRVRKVTAPDGAVTRTEYAGVWTHVYDAEDNKTSTKADFLGREVQRKLYEGLSTTPAMQYDYTYDGLDRLLTTTVGGSTVTNTWDRLGRMRQVDDPDSGTWHTRFDLNGNAILQDDPKSGQRVEACHDEANRVILQCSFASDGTAHSLGCQGPPPAEPTCGSGTEIARYTYDLDPDGSEECGGAGRVGRLTSVVDTSGGECWAYDARGRVTTQKKTILHNATPTTAKTDFGYDEADHLLWIRYPEQIVGHEDYTYQADGLPETLETFVAAAEYDLFGRLTKLTSYRNTEDIYTYDTAGTDNFRLQSIQTKQFSTSTVYLNLTQSYWPRGKLKHVDDLRDAGTPLSNQASYCYDGLGRLTQVDRDPTSGGSACSTPDETFSHNEKGNLVAKNGTSFGFAVPARPHQPTSFGAYSTISYDANGSRTLKDKGSGNKDELIYDARGLLTEVKRWTNGSVTSSQTNLYDYAGSRVVKAPSSGAGTTIRSYSRYAEVGGGNLTKYYYFGGRMIASYTVPAPAHLQTGDRDPELVVPPARIELPPELLLPFAGGVLLLLFLPLGRRRWLGVHLSLARSASLSVVFLVASSPVVLLAGCGSDPVVRVYHVDHLGSTQVVTDWQGNIFRQIRYAAYGEIRGRFNSAGNPAGFSEDARFEFTGYETDFAGLDCAGARFFDPELAQFGSHDPAGQYPSPYAYGPGDPVNGTDPGGAIFGIDDAILYAIAIYAYQAAVTAGIAATVAFVDTYRQTGSARAGVRAAGDSIANSVTGGGYGLVKAISNDEAGHYLASYAANMATAGIYGTAQAFNDGQIGAGVLGAIQIAGLAYGAYSAYQASGEVVSGNEVLLADNSGATDVATPMTETILNSLPENEPWWHTVVRYGVYDWKDPLGGSYALEAMTILPIGKVLKAGKVAARIGRSLDDIIGNADTFKRWLKHKHPTDKPLSIDEARRVWDRLVETGRSPRLDPGHAHGEWTMPHINVNGKHIPVDPGFSP